jgi:CRISPR/Cas system-associated exonuclease Cas4 (RecB family)
VAKTCLARLQTIYQTKTIKSRFGGEQVNSIKLIPELCTRLQVETLKQNDSALDDVIKQIENIAEDYRPIRIIGRNEDCERAISAIRSFTDRVSGSAIQKRLKRIIFVLSIRTASDESIQKLSTEISDYLESAGESKEAQFVKDCTNQFLQTVSF